MSSKKKTIISCAITGSIHTPTMSDALPYKPDDIAQQAIDAANAGASILHLHARDPETGAPSLNPEHFAQFLGKIKEQTNAVVNISTGGSLKTSIDDRIAPAKTFEPEMCSLNMGSINFSFHPIAKRYEKFKFDWEQSYLADSDTYIFRNSFADITKVATELAPLNVKFEHECYDVGHLYNLSFCLNNKLFKPPVFIQFVMGILGGIGAEIDNLAFMKQTADKLFGDDYQWSVLGAGAAQMSLATAASQIGGNVRVGLEDSVYISKGVLASSNAEQVTKIKNLMQELGSEIATPDETRQILDLKGIDNVKF